MSTRAWRLSVADVAVVLEVSASQRVKAAGRTGAAILSVTAC